MYVAGGYASWHPGGCHFTLADGSAHFLSQNIDQNLLRALTTRSGPGPGRTWTEMVIGGSRNMNWIVSAQKRSPLRIRILLLVGWSLTIYLSGCGGEHGPERVIVYGSVSYNGKPVSEGTIRFMPTSKSSVPVTSAPIKDGKYRADVHGGVCVGTFAVQIEGRRRPKSGTPVRLGVKEEDQREQYIPQKCNAKTTLEVAIPSGSRELAKDFDLTDN